MRAENYILALLVATVLASDCLHPKYAVWPSHTACLSKSSYASNPRGIDSSTAVAIVEQHNRLRGSVSPPAGDMQLMAWDDEIASIAQKWADNCAFDHDKMRLIPGRFPLGQNLAYGHQQWSDAIRDWYDEYKDFRYGSGATSPGAAVLHYTQVVWSNSSKIGCGFATCSNLPSPRFYVCNYGPAGNMQNTVNKPYKSSAATCSACPGRCKNALCDCGGKACYNGGILDVRTCECRCSAQFHVGSTCNLNCSSAQDDSSFCGFVRQQGCYVYSNVPDLCPLMCDLCSGDFSVVAQSAYQHTSGQLLTALLSLAVTVASFWP